jgi:hypothetical protein
VSGGKNLRSFAALDFAFLDHMQAFDRKIVNLDCAEMQPIDIRPQDAQAPNGKRSDRQCTERKRTDCERARRQRRHAHWRQFEIFPPPAPNVSHCSMHLTSFISLREPPAMVSRGDLNHPIDVSMTVMS